MTMRAHLLMSGKVNKEGLSIEEAAGEPRQGCLSSLASQTKGGFGDRFRGLAWDKLPAAHCLGPEETRDCEERSGGRGREREWHWPLPRGRAWVPCLEAFLSRRWESWGRSQGRVQWDIPQLSRCALSGSWSPLIGQWQGRWLFSHCSWFWLHRPPGPAVFLAVETRHN